MFLHKDSSPAHLLIQILLGHYRLNGYHHHLNYINISLYKFRLDIESICPFLVILVSCPLHHIQRV